MNRLVVALFSAVLIFAAAGYYVLLSKLNDFEDPLLNAAYQGNLQTVAKLVASGKSVDFQDAYGNCALTLSLYGRHSEVAHYLLEQGARAETLSSAPPLHLAIELDCLITFNDLLSHGANPDHRDRNLRTPIMAAACSPNDTYLKVLLDRGADVEEQDEDGWRALHYCVLSKSLPQPEKLLRLEQLIHAGADVNARNIDAAYKMSQRDSQLGSDRSPPKYGETALEIATKNGFKEIANFLRNSGAK